MPAADAAPAFRPTLGPILLGTVVVPDLAEATSAYTGTLGFVVQHEGAVTPSLAGAWQAPLAEGSAYRILGSAPGRSGGVRLVERRDRSLEQSPLRVPGWRSLEICVSDVHAVRARLEGSPFTVLGEPAPLGADSPIWALQAVGPGREMLYLTQTVPDSGFDLPLAERLIDRMFIAVMTGAPTLEPARDWYAREFGAGPELPPAPYVLVACSADAGLPPGREYRIAALGLAGQSLVEIDDHFPEHAGERPPAGDLRGGIAMITWEVDSLDAVRHLLRDEPVRRDEPPYAGRRTAVAVGAAGELLELVERA
jgi:catechol 2,3-dioxygenase-like lactoylglutathione lyase family enzyme